MAAEEETLSVLLKAGTKENHKTAERSGIMLEIIKKTVSKEKYIQFTIDLYHMYTVLESALEENKNNEVLKPIYFPEELNRVPSLERDLAFFLGENWKEEERVGVPRPPVKEYQDAVKTIAAEEPELLLSHAYVRYLGDVNGGQILAKILKGLLDLEDGQGLEFYAFPKVANVRALSKQFKAGMDKVLDKSLQNKLVEEANKSYVLQIDILTSI